MGRSLSEFLRMTWEWSQVALEPFNSMDNPAIVARAFYENCGMPDTVLTEISQLPDMYIFKYIKGDTTARMQDSDSYPDVSEEAKSWFRDFCSSHPYQPLSVDSI